tara:strand:+ start:1519 stop:2664 length:1146 start_codon:yes stop_codon:yes gene_type:complete
MKILHIINSLNKGGAEGNLYRLTKFHKKKYKDKIDIIIITLIDNGFYEADLKKNGIKIFSLGISRKKDYFELFKKILKFRKYVLKNKPDIIQSWMYHSNLLTIFIPKKFSNKIYWNIRHSILNLKMSKITTIISSIVCSVFSRITPKKIFYCSEKSVKFHENVHFYSKKKTSLIENGYNKKLYYSSKYKKLIFRKKNNLKNSDIVLGFAGRYAKEKNINSLLLAFSKITKFYDNIYLCMAGKNINFQNKELMTHINNYKIKKNVLILNEQKNLLEFYNGVDLLVLVSHAESFPNVVAEAMLCSTPVMSSNVGCSKKIIDDCGFVIQNNDYLSILRNLKKIIHLFKNNKREWSKLKIRSQLKIEKNFSIEKMANAYLENWNL